MTAIQLPDGSETEIEDHDPGRLSYEVYLAERKMLLDAEGEASKSLDQNLLTLSAAALGISLTLIKDVFKAPIESHLLVASWLLFGLALLSTLLSLYMAQYAMRRQLGVLEAVQNATSPLSWWKKLNVLGNVIELENWISVVAFSVGVICLAGFSISNYYR